MASATFKFQVASLDGGYDAQISANSPISNWNLNEGSSTQSAADIQAANPGTYAGSPTMGAPAIWDASGNPAITFDGVDDTVSMGDVAAFRFTGAFTVSVFVKYTAVGGANGSGIVTKIEAGSVGVAGWGLLVNSFTGKLQFVGVTAAQAIVFTATTTLAYNDGLWHHVMCTWDGTTTANKVIIYVDGSSVKTATAVAGTLGTGTYPFRLGARGNTAADFYAGTLARPSVYNTALTAANAASHAAYLNDWANTYNADWVGAEPTTIRRGMGDNNPTSRTAAVGTAEFALDNSAQNSLSTLGGYSPDVAVGLFGKRIRFLATSAGVDYPLWSGRIRSLMPDAGKYGPRLVHATGHDAMGDLALFTVREVTPQISKTEPELIKTVLESLPSAVRARPISDATKETYPYALDNIGGDAGNGLSVLEGLVASAWGLCWPDVYNAVRYRNRMTQDAKTFTATFTDADIEDLVIFGSENRKYTRFRVTVHPRFVDTAATSVLCSGAGQFVPGNSTVTLWLDYADPNQKHTLIGGTAQVTPLTTPAHYLANAAADGSGANLTANISIVTTAFAAAAKFVITNSAGTDAYMTLLQLLGKGIYDDGPVTHEFVTISPGFYDNTFELDMPYRANGIIPGTGGSNLADMFDTAYETNITGESIAEIAFNPQRSTTLMGYALTMDIGDIVRITETVSGLSAEDATIVGISHELVAGSIMKTRWNLAPRAPFTTAW